MDIILNGFSVDPSLAKLMLRADWQRQRTDERWLDRFPAHPACEAGRVPFVEFCAPDWAERENKGLKAPALAVLRGTPSTVYTPGDFDPDAGYLIGFTGEADSAICVDLRPSTPRIIYDCFANSGLFYATAFASVAEFVQFYVDQHGQ